MADNRHFTIALAGNPNCGKTTLFNGLTGSRQRIGNWPGVTVEKKEGTIVAGGATRGGAATRTGSAAPEAPGSGAGPVERFLAAPFVSPKEHTALPSAARMPDVVHTPEGDVAIRVVDLPGIYALSASSEDEAVARDYLLSGDADLVVNIVDASNIQRNLFLTLQLIEMGVPVIVVLNMMDVADKKGIGVDVEHLSEHLDCPIIAASAIKPKDILEVRQAIRDYAGKLRPSKVSVLYPETVEDKLEALEYVAGNLAAMVRATPRWIALKLLEGDPWVEKKVLETSSLDAETLATHRQELVDRYNEELDVVIADSKYGFIHGLSRHVSRNKVDRRSLTERVDRVVMNRILALPIFFGVMYLVFWFTMAVGGAFIDFFDIFFGTFLVDGLGSLLAGAGAPEWLTLILADGIGGGIQTVATFVPIIFTMFVALSILEDSGYMARAAYVMDRFMRAVGLPGKSFVPMMVGFGCTVPAIMGTRTLETTRDRFTTIFMSPNMSCGARLPVYALFAAAFFAGRSGFIVFSLYVVGIMIAIGTGFLLKATLFRGRASHFVMELPPYHAPRAKYVFGQAGRRLGVFVKRAGITITIIVTILSVMNSLRIGAGEGEDSTVLAGVGRAITPVFSPMGIEQDNWPATVGLFTGIFAKEAVVGTLNSIYLAETPDKEGGVDIGGGVSEAFASIPANLSGMFGALTDPLGTGIVTDDEASVGEELEASPVLFERLRSGFTQPGAYAYLLFVLIYFPCVAALAAAIREMGAGLGWLLAIYSTVVAWSVATLFFQLTTGPNPVFVVLAFALLGLMGLLFLILGRTVYRPGKIEALGPPGRRAPSKRSVSK